MGMLLTVTQELLSDAHRPATQHRDGETEPGKIEEPFTVPLCSIRKSLDSFSSSHVVVAQHQKPEDTRYIGSSVPLSTQGTAKP